MSEYLLATLQRIEDAQKEHTEKLDSVNANLAAINTKQEHCVEVQHDHETRLRASESILVKVTVFFAGASVIFGAAVTWSVDKLLSVAN